MPNWCSNTLEVSGMNPEQLKEFKTKSLVPADNKGPNEYDFTFEGIHPTPPESLEDDWYNWRILNWGTKWDCSESYIAADTENTFIVSYDTAWAPNISWIQKASEMFPDLYFKLSFMEPGCNFCGVAYCENGDLSVDEGPIEWTDENGNVVETNDDCMWYRVATNEVIEDEDFYPFENNPFDN